VQAVWLNAAERESLMEADVTSSLLAERRLEIRRARA
jgi:hypothetical protein